MDSKKLCLKLANCDTEESVIGILQDEGYWDNPKVWRDYGDKENNFSEISNQQSDPDKALVEKITNSVDAVLMAECLEKGINPESEEAPQSIDEALEYFFNIRDGKLANITVSERNKLSKRICLVATGSKTKPCYSIIDQGEGQKPSDMPETLLSISKKNKFRIPFVQGKFNMGGTGAFQFCGKNNIQLVISRRHPNIVNLQNDSDGNKWGFTVIRRFIPTDNARLPIYRYLAPSNQILSFESSDLPLLPGSYPKPYVEKLKWGTFIKLYEYIIPGLRTNIVLDLYNRLSLLIPTIALPVKLYERRKGYSGDSSETTLSGITVRLEEEKKKNIEEGFPVSSMISVQGQKMKVSIFVFKKGMSENYKKSEGIIFTLNGQMNGDLSNRFFKRNQVDMAYLADSILVIVDCSDFDLEHRSDFFMASRDRLRNIGLLREIKKELEGLIKNHQGLRELKERRRREVIEDKLDDSKPLADVLEDIIQKSPTLSKLFIEGVRLPNPFHIMEAKHQDEYHAEKHPTFFNLKKEYTADSPKKCPESNSRLQVEYTTNAINDYLDRDSDPGVFTLKINGIEAKDYSIHLWNGDARLNVLLPLGISNGEVIKFESLVTDIGKPDGFRDEFLVKITDVVQPHSGGIKGKSKPPSDDKGDGSQDLSQLALPNIIEVEQEEWGNHSFTEKSALRIIPGEETGNDFFVNIHNIHLLTELKGRNEEDTSLLKAQYKYGLVLLGLALLHGNQKGQKEGLDVEEDIYGDIEKFTTSVSPFILPMIDSLGKLTEEDVGIDYETE